MTIRQNEIMETQSRLLDAQGKREARFLEFQSHLLEQQNTFTKAHAEQAKLQTLQNIAAQRAVYQPQINQFFAKVSKLRNEKDAEPFKLDEQKNPPSRFEHRLIALSDSMLSELRGLLSRLTPYHVIRYENGSIDNYQLDFISPERGQILEGLMRAAVSLTSGAVSDLDFSYADLRGINISFQEPGTDFQPWCSPPGSDLRYNNIYSMSGINLEFADLSDANIEHVDVDLTNVVANHTVFSESRLTVNLDTSKTSRILVLRSSPINFESANEHGLPTGKPINLKGLHIELYRPGCFLMFNEIPIDKVPSKQKTGNPSELTIPVLFEGASISFSTENIPSELWTKAQGNQSSNELIDYLLTKVIGIDKKRLRKISSGRILFPQNDGDAGLVELDFGFPPPSTLK